MSDLLGGIESAVGDIFGGGGGGGGDFLSELMNLIEGGSGQGHGGGGALGDIAKIAGDVMPLLAMF